MNDTMRDGSFNSRFHLAATGKGSRLTRGSRGGVVASPSDLGITKCPTRERTVRCGQGPTSSGTGFKWR